MRPAPRPSRFASRPRAFTLIELLTVIAIIGILSAITFAGIRRAMLAGRSAVCLSNLRQVGFAAQQFAADNKDATPGQIWFYPYSGSEAATRGTLAPYLRAPANWTDYAKSVLTCPEQQSRFPSSVIGLATYTINGLCISRNDLSQPLAPQTGSNQPRTLRLSESTAPARHVFFFDGLPQNETNSPPAPRGWYYKNTGFGGAGGDFATYQRFVHSEIANAVFLDGHCEKIPKARFLSHSATSLFWTGR